MPECLRGQVSKGQSGKTTDHLLWWDHVCPEEMLGKGLNEAELKPLSAL